MAPLSSIVPPYTFTPMFFFWPRDSPVSILSSQHPDPKTTIPSTGTVWPLVTLIKSFNSSNSISVSTVASLSEALPLYNNIALVTFNLARLLSFSTVYFLDNDSRNLPSKMTVISDAEISKLWACSWTCLWNSICNSSTSHSLKSSCSWSTSS